MSHAIRTGPSAQTDTVKTDRGTENGLPRQAGAVGRMAKSNVTRALEKFQREGSNLSEMLGAYRKDRGLS